MCWRISVGRATSVEGSKNRRAVKFTEGEQRERGLQNSSQRGGILLQHGHTVKRLCSGLVKGQVENSRHVRLHKLGSATVICP